MVINNSRVDLKHGGSFMLKKLEKEFKECFLDIAQMLMISDGDSHITEKELMTAFKKKMGVEYYEPKTQSNDYIISTLSPASISDKKKIIFELAALAMIDNVYSDKEREILDNLAEALDIPASFIQESFNIIDGLKDLYKKSALLVSE